MLKKNDIITAEIIDISSDGNGVARFDNFAVFIPKTAIGDVCKIKIAKVLSSYAFGILEELITPSIDRIPPECPLFKTCGGCDFFHINYEAEKKAKFNIVSSAFKRIAKSSCLVNNTQSANEFLRYRNKSQFPVSIDEKGNAYAGFYAKRSHRVIPCNDCLLQPKEINTIINFTINKMNFYKIKGYNEATNNGDIRHIYTRFATVTNEIMLCLVATKKDIKNLDLLVNDIVNEFKNIKTIVLNINSKNTNVILGDKSYNLYGEGFISDVLCDIKLDLSPKSFYQVNHAGAQKLYNISKESLNLSKDDILLDMYCGAGGIGLSMASKVKQLVGVEIVDAAVKNAIQNAKVNNIDNAYFICSDAKDAAKMLLEKNFLPTAVVLDPPRKGCDKDTLDAIISMKPNKISMISCNPATAARDALYLTENGYKIEFVTPFDLFPRTKHVECVCLLTKI